MKGFLLSAGLCLVLWTGAFARSSAAWTEDGGQQQSEQAAVAAAPGDSKDAREQPAGQPVREEIVVTAPRVEIPLQEIPAATSVVTVEALRAMPRAIAAEEALRLVPGVKVDNQADGERVHLSIRGQGLLTERGVRGIKVVLDGLPLNDPTGFAPDLFDVDWSAVEKVEVVRGPSSAIYGGGSSGGILAIETRDGGATPVAGDERLTLGSNGFWKAFTEVGGSTEGSNYRLSASRAMGDGYRDHTRFHATNLYGKIHFAPGSRLRLTLITAGTSYFNDNAEGLNLGWLRQDRRMANPDALTFNEYQRTRRGTLGLTGSVEVTAEQKLSFALYYRDALYEESVPSSLIHRQFETPGGIFQYTFRVGGERFRQTISVGTDLDWQQIDELKRPNLGDAVEGPTVVTDQTYRQRSEGYWISDRVELARAWNLVLDLRHDRLRNELDDHLQAGGVDLSGETTFEKTTGRVGVAYNPVDDFGLFASWGQGFLPPATEELANNPDQLGGFNRHLEPATSRGPDLGIRGRLSPRFDYEMDLFYLRTDQDFGRYRIASRPLETFYQNAGKSERWGVEGAFDWFPCDDLTLRAAYTYSHFEYVEVRTITGETFRHHTLPNAPRHQAYVDGEYRLGAGFSVGLGAEVVTRWAVDASETIWADGYTLLHPRAAYAWQGKRARGEFAFSIRNLTGVEYIAFTEPDPDGNSYQPAPKRQLFLSAGVKF